MTRPFRFIAPAPRLTGDPARWRAEVRRIEDLGFSTLSVGDHLSQGWVLEPVTAMTVAAEATEPPPGALAGPGQRLPAPRRAAQGRSPRLDVFSGGRVELGIGAGWMAADYDAAGIPMDPPGRADRAARGVPRRPDGAVRPGAGDLLRASTTRSGTSTGLPEAGAAAPAAVAGRRRRTADALARGPDRRHRRRPLHPARRGPGRRRRGRPRRRSDRREGRAGSSESAEAAGRSPDELELQFSVYHCEVTGRHPRGGDGRRSSFAVADRGAPRTCSPTRRRSSSVTSSGASTPCWSGGSATASATSTSGHDVEAVAPVVARLSGT